ncbi:Uncharacterised protein r2_g4055 [Pycnogonum litorale]
MYTNKDDVLKYYNEVNTVSSWSKHRSLTINAKKTKELVILTKNLNDPVLTEMVKLDGVDIVRIYTAKYLGVYLDNKLNFKHEINTVINTIKQRLFYASKLLKNYQHKVIVKDFVFACILPILTYALHVYVHFLYKSSITEIRKIIKRLAFLCNMKSNVLENIIENEMENATKKVFRNVGTSSLLSQNVYPRVNKAISQRTLFYQMLRANRENKKYFKFENKSICCDFC